MQEIDWEQQPELAKRHQVKVVPTLLLVHRGQIVDRIEGAVAAETLWARLAQIDRHALAHRHPERVASLFLIEAHFAVEGWGEQMAGSLALAAFGLDEDAVQDWLAENADRKLSRMAKRSERFLMETSLIDDLQAEEPITWLPEITCPTFAMYGAETDIMDRALELQAKVPGCELEIVPDCSHSLLTEQSALVRERALAWLARVG